MKRTLTWKIIAIVVFALLLSYYDAPDAFQKIPGTPSFIKDAKIHLGLDLQGGTQLDFKIDLSKVPPADAPQIIEGVREVLNRRINGLGVSEPNIFVSEVADEKHIVVELAGVKDIEEAKRTVGKTIQLEFKEQKGEPDPKEKAETERKARQLFGKIKKKPDQFAVLGYEAEQTSPGKVKFKEKLTESYTEDESELVKFIKTLPLKGVGFTPKETSFPFTVDRSGQIQEQKGFAIVQVLERKEETNKEGKVEKQITYNYILFSTIPDPWKDTGLTGEHFKYAQVDFTQFGAAQVAIQFNNEGAKLFEEITERNKDKPLAIFVGGDLISAPNVNQKISGGQAVITGNFSAKEAQELARDLNTGAIPAPIVLTGQYSIGASLGQEALQQSMKAGILGLIFLALFMILYYRLPGFLATITLGIYTTLFLFLLKSNLPLPIALLVAIVIFVAIIYKILNSEEGGWEKLLTFVLACFILFFVTFLLSTPVVLTLAGVAGVILSIGMAVDANVLIFERLKEELKTGRPLSAAIEIGFDRAWSSIRDSNFSSLITCAILYYFGTSIIRGFALTLAAGILISMFTAITITKSFLLATVNTKLSQNLWLFGLPKEKKAEHTYNIIGKTKLWFILSGIVIFIGLGSLLTSGLRFGLDFTGGTLLDLKFEKTVMAEEIRSVVPNATVVPTGDQGAILRMEHIDSATHDKIIADLRGKFGSIEEIRFTTIGPTIGNTLKKRALLALGLALMAIVLYVAFAFRKVPRQVNSWKFGICAIVALIHDTIIPIGIFSLLKVEIDAFFITALLTIIGFSVHDTIVVFDRIRENLKTHSGESLAEIAHKSMNQTMARSINTSLTTVITLLALLFFGSSSIFYFTLALVIGITVGTYSSIFVASPLLVLWKKKQG